MEFIIPTFFHEQGLLSYQLTPITWKELLFLTESPGDIYGRENHLYKLILPIHNPLDKEFIQKHLSQGHPDIFISWEHYRLLKQELQNLLRHVTRSLSIGDSPANNVKKQISLLCHNLNYLYQEPSNDDILGLQYKGLQNLISLLIQIPQLSSVIFKEAISLPQHYIFHQPLLSSLLLLSYLIWTRQFSEKEIESLFLTSYFKDIGMSNIPAHLFDKKNLSEEEKSLLGKHAEFSYQILKNRLPLDENYLLIIKNHHLFSLLPIKESQNLIILGIETVSISVVDCIVAMTMARPYRRKFEIYSSLSFIKKYMEKENFPEFKILVQFLQKFYASI